MGAAGCPFPSDRRTSRRARRSEKSSPAVKYVPFCRQHTVQKRTQRCEIEVYSPGRRTKAVGRDTWRHMWSPHWHKSTCRQSVPVRYHTLHFVTCLFALIKHENLNQQKL